MRASIYCTPPTQCCCISIFMLFMKRRELTQMFVDYLLDGWTAMAARVRGVLLGIRRIYTCNTTTRNIHFLTRALCASLSLFASQMQTTTWHTRSTPDVHKQWWFCIWLPLDIFFYLASKATRACARCVIVCLCLREVFEIKLFSNSSEVPPLLSDHTQRVPWSFHLKRCCCL